MSTILQLPKQRRDEIRQYIQSSGKPVLEIVRLMSHGHNQEEIGARLGYAKRTVEDYVSDIKKGTRCKTQAHLVATFLRGGFIS